MWIILSQMKNSYNIKKLTDWFTLSLKKKNLRPIGSQYGYIYFFFLDGFTIMWSQRIVKCKTHMQIHL